MPATVIGGSLCGRAEATLPFAISSMLPTHSPPKALDQPLLADAEPWFNRPKTKRALVAGAMLLVAGGCGIGLVGAMVVPSGVFLQSADESVSALKAENEALRKENAALKNASQLSNSSKFGGKDVRFGFNRGDTLDGGSKAGDSSWGGTPYGNKINGGFDVGTMSGRKDGAKATGFGFGPKTDPRGEMEKKWSGGMQFGPDLEDGGSKDGDKSWGGTPFGNKVNGGYDIDKWTSVGGAKGGYKDADGTKFGPGMEDGGSKAGEKSWGGTPYGNKINGGYDFGKWTGGDGQRVGQ
ncbi:hypothetical protein EMIHUDRAFT_221746 [Emiliania huxleyi CCMP1516]|uniref:Uncharacterized protein n=2 Tax=Emiliania huxleyi TaxID=2903 RepID=A0A0D3HY50_EMIH1|nr:hypothetical protein EMIHUDRAFT_221746 [Emiliania huxleyi CCMP1516]EOD03935.1 hypothetical protein EMIHUDRAFT_221746 [Emiliania huxleyi CCMP1516]|eukprot:XP_005756364.1 hypothetical protein EMIHUDRAFT_221746 [Emiliania huxleyi CCMP1516]